MTTYRIGPDERDLTSWESYLSEFELNRIKRLASEGEDDDWRSLKLNLNELRAKNEKIYERILNDPISELEKGEFVLQRMLEEHGGHFEINLQFVGLDKEYYVKPEQISSKNVDTIIWFDAGIMWVSQLKPWFKKAAWKCDKCKCVTLVDNKKSYDIQKNKPMRCVPKNGGCGSFSSDSPYIPVQTGDLPVTKFELIQYQGTLLDLRHMVLADYEDCMLMNYNLLHQTESKKLNSVAVGPIARALGNVGMNCAITGWLKVSNDGIVYELELLGIEPISDEKKNLITSMMDGEEE